MKSSDRDQVRVSRVPAIDEQFAGLPQGLSLFDPFLRHEAKEAIAAGGEVYIALNERGETDGLFIYDGYEATGTVFTKSKDVFERFYGMKPSSYIFSEVDHPGLPKEDWNIWQLDVDKAPVEHRFQHHVSMSADVKELERFMAMTQPETNLRWVGVALRSGDKCFVTKVADRVVGIAWMTIVGGFARSHGLYTEPRFRRTGVMRDNFQARLIYLKSRRVHTLINEIAVSNEASSSHAASIGEKVLGRLYLYTTPEGKNS